MTGIILLVIRTALAISIYAFLGWALVTLWQDLRQQKKTIENQNTPKIRLEIQIGEDIQKHTFQGTEIIIGRDPSCECSIPSETVSAQHARFSFHHGQWWLEDLKSTNGTRLNQEILTTSVVVIPGDEINCGDVQLNILEE